MKRHLEHNSEFFQNNRKTLAKQLEPSSVAVFYSADIFSRSADAVHEFFQDPNLYYFTGLDQEDIILLISKDANGNTDEYLFIKETNDQIRLWEGDKYSMEQAKEISGISKINWTKNFDGMVKTIVNKVQNIYFAVNEHPRATFDGDYMNLRKMNEWKVIFPLHTFKRLAPIVTKMRMAKSQVEIDWMQKACDITTDTFVKLLKEIKNFKYEFEVESFITYEFNKQRATHAYDPIIACGENACVLHYVENDKELKKGELLLMDFGAFYTNYCADLSRTIPIGGKFSERQKEVYQATLNVFKHAKNNLSTNIDNHNWHQDTCQYMLSELKRIGLVDKNNEDPNAFRKYFPHGTGHSIGLNVHDEDLREDNFCENFVTTDEPGIYIREEGIGVRIENDIVIKKDGILDLMEKTPIEIDEIEDLMN